MSNHSSAGSDWIPRALDVATHRIEPELLRGIIGEVWVRDLVAAQIDADPQFELCLLHGFSPVRVDCFDGASRALDFEWTDSTNGGQRLEVADRKGDGRDDLFLAGHGRNVRAFGGSPFALLWTSEDLGSFYYNVAVRVGQLDADSDLEIAVAPADNPGAVVVLEAATGQLEAGPFAVGATAIEIVPSPSGGGGALVVGTPAGVVARLDLGTGVLGPPDAELLGPIASIRAVDFTRDGTIDLALLAAGSGVIVLDGLDDSVAWESEDLGKLAAWFDGLHAIDLEGNGIPDLLVDNWAGFAVFEAGWIAVFRDGFETGGTEGWSLVSP